MHYVTDYQTWNNGVSYAVNTIVYKPDKDKHYKSVKTHLLPGMKVNGQNMLLKMIRFMKISLVLILQILITNF